MTDGQDANRRDYVMSRELAMLVGTAALAKFRGTKDLFWLEYAILVFEKATSTEIYGPLSDEREKLWHDTASDAVTILCRELGELTNDRPTRL